MEAKKITEAMREQLGAPLPLEAVSPHPTKKFLSSIKSIYVTERLNEVFGVGSWKLFTEYIEKVDKMVVVKVTFRIPEYNIDYECFGGNDNADLGDAYKGATTDALTKIASWLGIGREVFKGEAGKAQPKSQPKPTATTAATTTPQKQVLTMDALMNPIYSANIAKLIHEQWSKRKNASTTIADVIKYYYSCDEVTLSCLIKEINRLYA
jgi:hypothetical protein